MTIEEIVQESLESDQLYLIKIYQFTQSGFYYRRENGVFFSQKFYRLGKEFHSEIPYKIIVVYKGKLYIMREKDYFFVNEKTGVVTIYQGKYDQPQVEEPYKKKEEPVLPTPPAPIVKQEGISIWIILLILLILIAIAVGIYLYCKRYSPKTHNLEESNQGELNYMKNNTINEPLNLAPEERLRGAETNQA